MVKKKKTMVKGLEWGNNYNYKKNFKTYKK